jgi:hypothetical protein
LSAIADLVQRLNSLDPELLGAIESETTIADKKSLLSLHRACRMRLPEFRWLEIGSHLGGSLQALVQDPACIAIDSIDPRSEVLADERLGSISYPANSTERMLGLLRELPEADVSKITTHEASSKDLDPTAMARPDLCFVDGEHTDVSCAQDAAFCRNVLRDRGVIAFHDVWIVYEAVSGFVQSLERVEIPHSLAFLPDSIFVVELGPPQLLNEPALESRQLENAAGVLWLLRKTGYYRDILKGRRARVLSRLGLLRAGDPGTSSE